MSSLVESLRIGILGINLQQRLAGGRLDRRAAFDEISALFDAASGRTDD